MSSRSTVFDPNLPLPATPTVRQDVLVIPWGSNPVRGAQRAAGLFASDGTYLREGICSRWGDDELTVEPSHDGGQESARLAGTWLYGGMLYGHFGHFLCESTARIWALDHISEQVTGILWLPKVPMGHAARMVRPYYPFFEALGLPNLKLTAPQTPHRVDRLLIPEQGFGIGLAAAGRPQYRDFMHRRLTAQTAPEGAEKLYVSRSRLPTKRGSILLEEEIEARMAAEGYEIFHPELHPVRVQIARYRAARWIVGPDGSALHLAAMVADRSARVAIINRGPSQNIDDYARQFLHFAGIEVLQIESICAFWFEAGRRVVKRETHALLDFSRISKVLRGAGFLAGPEWDQPAEAALERALQDRQERSGQQLQRHEMEAPR